MQKKPITTTLLLLFLTMAMGACGGQKDEVERDVGMVALFNRPKQLKILLELIDKKPGAKRYTLIWASKVRHMNYEKKLVYSPDELSMDEYENMVETTNGWKLIRQFKNLDVEKLKGAIKKGYIEQ